MAQRNRRRSPWVLWILAMALATGLLVLVVGTQGSSEQRREAAAERHAADLTEPEPTANVSRSVRRKGGLDDDAIASEKSGAVVALAPNRDQRFGDEHGVVEDAYGVCSGLIPIRLEATAANFNDLDVQTLSQRRARGECEILVGLRKSRLVEAPRVELAPTQVCQIDATPRALDPRGVDIQVTSTGDCTGLEVFATVDFDKPKRLATISNIASTSMVGSNTALAKIVGNDTIHLPMFLHYARLTWNYDGFDVQDGVHSNLEWEDGYWSMTAHTEQVIKHTGGVPHYEDYNYVQWFSAGFPVSSMPDVTYTGQPTVFGWAYGGYSCAFWESPGAGWDHPLYNPPLGAGMHTHFQCAQ